MLGENGVRMSGGQRQRIALARAFYHNRNIIIMDEATSALDNETEAKIFNEVDLFRKERTVIIITHKIDTLKKCDSIYKIENKAVRRVGNYHDLFHNKS
jgi:ATP-binding cassette subfamily B protein